MKLSKSEEEILSAIKTCNRIEVHESNMRHYKRLQKLGLISFGHARGPGNMFRRASLMKKGKGNVKKKATSRK